MEYELTEHARVSLTIRSNIRLIWLERVLEQPQRVEPDPIDPELEHRLARIDEYGRYLLLQYLHFRHPWRSRTRAARDREDGNAAAYRDGIF